VLAEKEAVVASMG